MNKTATLIRNIGHNGGPGDWRLYRLDPPIEGTRYDWEAERYEVAAAFEYVIVSAAHVPYTGPETYIFGANDKGEVIDWSELHGSFRGSLDHEEALRGAGYEVSR